MVAVARTLANSPKRLPNFPFENLADESSCCSHSRKVVFQDRGSMRACGRAGARFALLGIGVSDAGAAKEPRRPARLSQTRCGNGAADQRAALRGPVHNRRREEATDE